MDVAVQNFTKTQFCLCLKEILLRNRKVKRCHMIVDMWFLNDYTTLYYYHT